MFRMKLLLIFLSGFVVTIACGFYLDTNSLISRYFMLHERHRSVRQKVILQKQSLQLKKNDESPLQADSKEWNRIIMKLNDSGLNVQSLSREDVDYHVVLDGDYEQFFHWLNQCGCEVRNIHLLENPQGVHAEMIFSMHDAELDMAASAYGFNPFCGGRHIGSSIEASMFTSQELRLVGIVRRSDKDYVLVQFPDTSIIEEPIGARIFGGSIAAIHDGDLTLTMPDQTMRVVKIDGI